MAHYPGGSFFGYRELLVLAPRPPRSRPRDALAPIKLSAPFMEHLGITCYDYRAFNGQAPRDYGSWTVLPWGCRMAKWMLDGGPIEVQFTYDETEIGDTRIIRSSTTTLDSFVGFRIRQLIPGFAAWYQCIAIL